MISKIYNYWLQLKSNLLFVPFLFCIFFGLTTFLSFWLESRYLKDYAFAYLIFDGDSKEARAIVIALLSAMITMVTVSVSLTMIVLSLAASQLGPRLINTFMSDPRTKDHIGIFFGTVLSCLIMTMILHSSGAENFTPKLTIGGVFALCIVNLFVLLAFVNHVAQYCIADHVILKVSEDLMQAVERLTKASEIKPKAENPDVLAESYEENWPKDFDRKSLGCESVSNGYIQNIDYQQIVKIAHNHGLYISIPFKAGNFLIEKEKMFHVYGNSHPDEELIQKLRSNFILGNNRTPTQDIEYSIRHLVEIALRALSPGINDNFTAMAVMDRLFAALAKLFSKDMPSKYIGDGQGRVRIICERSSEATVIFTALDVIRQNSRSKPDMVEHFLKRLKTLATLSDTKVEKEGIIFQLERMKVDIEDLSHSEDLYNSYKELRESL